MDDPIYIPDSPPPPPSPSMPNNPTTPPESSEMYCILCLRVCPPGREFLQYGSANAGEFQESVLNNVGLELAGETFDVCTPCWKMVHLMEDFRLCCFKTQERLRSEEGCRGLSGTEDWFQVEVVEAIDSLRSIIEQQVMDIEGEEGEGDFSEEEDSMQAETGLDEEEQSLPHEQIDIVEENEGLVTQISVGDFKIEVFDDEVQEDCNTQSSVSVESPGIIDELKCAKCDLCLENQEAFRKHIKNCRFQAKRNYQSNGRHTCMICLISFKHHHLLEAHMNRNHGVKSYECSSNCIKSSDSSVTCKVCNAILANSGSLRSHMVVAHGQRRFSCDYCSKKFTRRYELKRHNKTVHLVILPSPPHVIEDQPEKTHTCKYCSSTFSSSTELVRHRKTAHQDLLKPTSSSSSSSPSQVIDLEKDPPVRKYPCPTCRRSFAKYLSLMDHVKRWHSHVVQEFIAARPDL